MKRIALLAILLVSPAYGQTEVENWRALAAAEAPKLAQPQGAEVQFLEVRNTKGLHFGLLLAARKAQRAGKITQAEFLKVRRAALLPRFRQEIEELAVMQFNLTGDESVPRTEAGKVDLVAINWGDGTFLQFLEALLPLILQLIDIISGGTP